MDDESASSVSSHAASASSPPLASKSMHFSLFIVAASALCLRSCYADSASSSVWDRWWAYDGISGGFSLSSTQEAGDRML